MKKFIHIKSLIILLSILSFSKSKAQNVLIIYDDSITNVNTVSLANALTTAGLPVTFSSVNESNWDNTNPSLNNFEAVIHLNGTTFATEMPSAGQVALNDFVENNNGLYVGFEWNAYQVDNQSQMQDMIDLVLFNRTETNQAKAITLNVVPAQSGHPIMAGVTVPFGVFSILEPGGLRTFASNPSTTIMTDSSSTADVVAMRDYGNGHVLGFSLVPNFDSSSTVLSSPEVQLIIINFIKEYKTNPTLVNNYNLKSKFAIYPNPSSEFIQISNLSTIEKYKLYNTLGVELINGVVSPDNNKINIHSLTNEFYFLQFDSGHTVKFKKE